MSVTVNALTDTVSPATPSELAELLGVDASDPLLPGMLQAATDAAEAFLHSAIVSREFEAYWENFPDSIPVEGLSAGGRRVGDNFVELPYTRLLTLTSVEVQGEPFTAYEVRRTNPARLYAYPQYGDLKVTYTAGWEVANVPGAIKQGILMAAAFLYEHRGTCDAAQALERSGGAGIMQRYQIELGF